MNFIEWDESMSVQVKEIDDQHKTLIGIVNKVHETDLSEDKEKGNQILNELIEFVRVHFSTEEKYFEKFKYEGTAEHIAEHIKLVEKVIGFKQLYDNGKYDGKMFLDFLKEWLKVHLLVTDQKYVKCFQEHGLS